MLMEDEDGEEDAVDRFEVEGEADGKGGDGALGTVQEDAHADGTAEGEQQQVCGVCGGREENGGRHGKTVEGQQDSQGGAASGHLQGGDSECFRNGAGRCGLNAGSIRGSRSGTDDRAGVGRGGRVHPPVERGIQGKKQGRNGSQHYPEPKRGVKAENQQDTGQCDGAQQQFDPGNPPAVEQRGDDRREKARETEADHPDRDIGTLDTGIEQYPVQGQQGSHRKHLQVSPSKCRPPLPHHQDRHEHKPCQQHPVPRHHHGIQRYQIAEDTGARCQQHRRMQLYISILHRR